ncbi:B12-binding domain-containing radical SAM protein [Candidatus Latescibacterota bacterium]
MLIDPGTYLHSYGLRTIAAQVKAAGHDVKVLCTLGALGEAAPGRERASDALRELLCNADVVGLSVYTNYLLTAAAISRIVRENSATPAIWGGVHATVCPEECLEHADIVCLGEGEDAILLALEALERGSLPTEVPNLWVRRGNAVHRNPVVPLSQCLDAYPTPDFVDLAGQYVGDPASGAISPLTDERLRDLSAFSGRYYGLPREHTYHGYLAMTTRGCPHRCAYCVNDALNRLYGSRRDVYKTRSVDSVISELSDVKARHPFYDFLFVFDDNFCARSVADLKRFATLYRERIGWPFKCNFHPQNATEEKIDILASAGLVSVEMGIESGSARTNREVYHRPHSHKALMRVASVLSSKYRDQIVPYYDVIMDNPYEDHGDISATIRLVQQIPRPMRLSHFSLTFFPGTELYRRAVADGHVQDMVTDVVRKKNNRLYADRDPYAKLLLSISPFVSSRLARRLISRAAHPVLLRLFSGPAMARTVGLFMRALIRCREYQNRLYSRLTRGRPSASAESTS